MFRHIGKNRTYFHNIKLASALSFVAGIVNIVGVLSSKILTTNITGHFAFFSEEVFLRNYSNAFVYLILIICFLTGAFCSSFIVELSSRHKRLRPHLIPLLIEILILGFVGLSDIKILKISISAFMIAGLLLVAMGTQNSLVTRVSQSVVRTTHLTGIFTDLGIELSKLFFKQRESEYRQLKKNIALKLLVIACFFSGCIIGGFLYKMINLKTLLLAAGLLFGIIRYDNFLYRYYALKRKLR
ncbi:YoaK family protein [Chryseobacterium sp. c4a]|uniref:YoaK family protein n=1 Tax=Chryseobacterium sp. c4a TaxID=1573582 RepID=UPI0013576E13|nr:YoaK family protein [Chryseobacterium sp. c4a]